MLDHLGLDDVTLLGISMGGYLCLRAAAFEPRIRRVIASSVAYDYLQFPPAILQPLMRLFLRRLRGFTNRSAMRQIASGGARAWWYQNLMYITRRTTPIEALDFLAQLSAEHLHCESITQDVMILTGRDDHTVPFKMHGKQVRALVNARSVRSRGSPRRASTSPSPARCRISIRRSG